MNITCIPMTTRSFLYGFRVLVSLRVTNHKIQLTFFLTMNVKRNSMNFNSGCRANIVIAVITRIQSTFITGCYYW